MSEPTVLPLNRCARRLGVTAKWLREEAKAGRIPALKAGSRLIFNVAAVEAALAERAAAERQEACDATA